MTMPVPDYCKPDSNGNYKRGVGRVATVSSQDPYCSYKVDVHIIDPNDDRLEIECENPVKDVRILYDDLQGHKLKIDDIVEYSSIMIISSHPEFNYIMINPNKVVS